MAAQGNDDPRSIEGLLRSRDKAEAAKWLGSGSRGVHRNIGEMSNQDSIEYVRELYNLGAIDVVVVNIGVNGKYESTDTLIITLPDDPAARKAIFDSEIERVEEMGYEQVADVGQRYLLSWFG